MSTSDPGADSSDKAAAGSTSRTSDRFLVIKSSNEPLSVLPHTAYIDSGEA